MLRSRPRLESGPGRHGTWCCLLYDDVSWSFNNKKRVSKSHNVVERTWFPVLDLVRFLISDLKEGVEEPFYDMIWYDMICWTFNHSTKSVSSKAPSFSFSLDWSWILMPDFWQDCPSAQAFVHHVFCGSMHAKVHDGERLLSFTKLASFLVLKAMNRKKCLQMGGTGMPMTMRAYFGNSMQNRP